MLLLLNSFKKYSDDISFCQKFIEAKDILTHLFFNNVKTNTKIGHPGYSRKSFPKMVLNIQDAGIDAAFQE